MRRIVIDLDGVLAEFNEPFRQLLLKEGAKVPAFGAGGPTEWHWFTPTATAEQVDAAWAKATPEWWGSLPVHADMTVHAYNMYEKLIVEEEITFVTSRPCGRNEAAEWLVDMFLLEDYLAARVHVVLTPAHKAFALLAMKPDVIIEDNLQTLQEVALKLPKCECILVDRPYNREGRGGFPLAIADNTEKALEEALYQNRAGVPFSEWSTEGAVR